MKFARWRKGEQENVNENRAIKTVQDSIRMRKRNPLMEMEKVA